MLKDNSTSNSNFSITKDQQLTIYSHYILYFFHVFMLNQSDVLKHWNSKYYILLFYLFVCTQLVKSILWIFYYTLV